jgi:hypothetical protein
VAVKSVDGNDTDSSTFISYAPVFGTTWNSLYSCVSLAIIVYCTWRIKYFEAEMVASRNRLENPEVRITLNEPGYRTCRECSDNPAEINPDIEKPV